jgi:Protein of unknown function (DUF789)
VELKLFEKLLLFLFQIWICELVYCRQWSADSDDSDGYYPESSSDGSCDSEHGRVMNNGYVVASNRHAPSHDSNNGGCKSELLFEYLEQNSPYMREPLSQKVSVFHEIYL